MFVFRDPRETYGRTPDPNDRDWKAWLSTSDDYYRKVQRGFPGRTVNSVGGYSILRQIEIKGITVLEIGASDIEHFKYWSGAPAKYDIIDTSESRLKMARSKLDQMRVANGKSMVVDKEWSQFRAGHCYSVVFAFNVLEHLYPLPRYLDRITESLVDDGILAGCIPCEGSLLLEMARDLVSKRAMAKRGLPWDKIISWSHPNLCSDVLMALDQHMQRVTVRMWPFPFLSWRVNLICQFIYRINTQECPNMNMQAME